ncbi:MAG: peptidoglycan synthetase [Bacteroidales bacterium]|nr:peptidoglycan synthetase [Bacteroidales bacterium]
MKVHFIAIGGAAMHSLAIALCRKGIEVTGSDDEIFDPARSHLAACGILPPQEGWHPERITTDLDAVVLGMHARTDNPELQRARDLGLKIYSYPEYLYEQSRQKTRIVVGGSHGKTTTTAMILHVLRHCGVDADYMVGAQIRGVDNMVRLSDTAKVMVIEGDEYLTSPIDPRPKFHLYHPHIAILTGIEWDHINVFPTFDDYSNQFAKFINLIEPDGHLIYCEEDATVVNIVEQSCPTNIASSPYHCPPYHINNGQTLVQLGDDTSTFTPIRVFGRHNLLNIRAAQKACSLLGISDADFAQAISTFEGAAKRLELVQANDNCAVYKDFAHAPSKLRATINAMREQYPQRKLVACIELHTFSSLTQQFLGQYHDTMVNADDRCVYFSQHALALKRLPPLDPQQVCDAFGGNVSVFTDTESLCQHLRTQTWHNSNLLMMSSGTFDGLDIHQLASTLLNR